LRQPHRKWGDVKRLAGALHVSRRTLENWRHADPKRRGRPPLPEPQQRAELACIAREVHRQGRKAGWRPVWKVLSGVARLSVVQRYVPALKRKRAQHRRRAREARRLHIQVHGENTLWSLDAAQMGRDLEGPVRAELVRDVGAHRTPGLTVSRSITHTTVIDTFELARRIQGTLPLVAGSDNGSENCNQHVAGYLREHQVIHLRSLPRVPQHNPWVEHTWGELRGETGIASDTRVDGVVDVERRLHTARHRLDHERWRPVRAPPSAHSGDKIGAQQYTPEQREIFYRTTCAAIEAATRDCKRKRERRKAEREAILATMERFGLITRTWGSRATSRVKCEGIT
jgi:hypothetical protein